MRNNKGARGRVSRSPARELSRTEGCQISVTSAPVISSVLEVVERAGLVAGPAGGAGLVTVLVSEGGGIEGGKGAAWLVAGLAVDDDGAEWRGGPDGAVLAAWKAAALALLR